MNKKIGMIGSIINAITVLLFAFFLLIDFKFGYFFVKNYSTDIAVDTRMIDNN